jgi:GTP-binding protein
MSPLRNVAIIAHVDHGKTTLVDQLLKQTGVFRSNQAVGEQILDSNPLERERGITILSKNISVEWKGVKVNIIDTPGHADFGGEVERVLRMADGALLLVDAFEGPMPQTRFVLRQSLALGHRVIVVLNKLDRPDARPDQVLDEVFDLFVELGADDRQLDFPVLYASAREGYARRDPLDRQTKDVYAILDTILAEIDPPPGDPEAAFRMQVTTFEDDDFIGRVAIGRIFSGRAERGRRVTVARPSGGSIAGRIDELFTFRALGRVPTEEAPAGDICAIAGIEDVEIGDTICAASDCAPFPSIRIEEPTIRMLFTVNDSPFSGKEGTYVTSRQVRDRLYKEAKRNVALRVRDAEGSDGCIVSGRGVLHLGILVENLRREGYEFQVGKPNVILKEIDGLECEPVEEAIVEAPSGVSGRVIELLGSRRGELVKLEQRGSTDHMVFHVPSRGLVGVRTRILTLTAGEAIFHHSFDRYEPHKGPIPHRQGGTLVSAQSGVATTYALFNLQDRGALFIAPGAPVYEGMIVGEFNKEGDPAVNVCRGRKLTNMRAASADRTLRLAPPRVFSVEEALEYIEDDELLEVTPKSLRLRKRILTEIGRKQAKRRDGAGVAAKG